MKIREKIAHITINRPQALNALNPETVKELADVLVDFRDDDNLWVGIVTGAGDKAFGAGADIEELVIKMQENPFYFYSFMEKMPTIMRGIELYKPLIAAVNGLALGGRLELALACDIVKAAKQATYRGTNMSLKEGLKVEADLVIPLFASEDLAEGRKTFMEKRKPEFKGK